MSKFVMKEVPTGVKFDLRAGNGQIVATSEIYDTQAACRKGMESVRKNAPTAHVEDQTAEGYVSAPNPKFELYTDHAGAFRFRLKAKNGRIIAVSEGYATKAACENGIQSVRKSAAAAQCELTTDES